jgi:hypothetical protein
VNHPRIREQLGDYLEGDLGTAARAGVDAHLVECAVCRDELRGLRATVALLRGLPDPEPPADLTAAVMARIEAERRPRLLRGAIRQLDAPRVAMALAAGLAGLAFLSNWQGSEQGQYESFPGAQAMPAPERAPMARAPGDAAGGATMRSRRPSASVQPPAARAWPSPPRRVASFASGVAPLGEFGELSVETASNRERELDRQLAWLLGDPSTFLARMGPDARGERFARLAQHAARRQQAGTVASRLISVPHPLTDDLIPRFLAASFAADLERRQPR